MLGPPTRLQFLRMQSVGTREDKFGFHGGGKCSETKKLAADASNHVSGAMS